MKNKILLALAIFAFCRPMLAMQETGLTALTQKIYALESQVLYTQLWKDATPAGRAILLDVCPESVRRHAQAKIEETKKELRLLYIMSAAIESRAAIHTVLTALSPVQDGTNDGKLCLLDVGNERIDVITADLRSGFMPDHACIAVLKSIADNLIDCGETVASASLASLADKIEAAHRALR